jgi:uncharacterized protein YbjT (DUF2867 family)
MMASLPVVPLPGTGRQQVQPIHIEDLVLAIGAVVQRNHFARRRVYLVGPQALTLREFLTQLRRALEMPPARFAPIPLSFMRAVATVAQFIPH